MAMSGTTPEPAPIKSTGLLEGPGQRKCPPSGPRSSIVSPTWATSWKNGETSPSARRSIASSITCEPLGAEAIE
jgi:hypothetical protein